MMRSFSSLARTLAPWICLRMSGEQLRASFWDGRAWRQTAPESLPQLTPFGCCVWLIAQETTCFRDRGFPADMIDAGSLGEAVDLDLETWSPWGEASGRFHWAVRQGEQWRVAIWTWDAERESAARARALADTGITPTHVMPEQAWRASCASAADTPALLLWPERGLLTCIWMDAQSRPARIATVAGEAEGMRFWRSIGGSADKVGRVYLPDEESRGALPDWMSGVDAQVLGPRPPPRQALARARLAGTRDWTDPTTWRKPLAALVALWLVWLAGSNAIRWNRNAAVEAELQRARVTAEEALSLHDRVRAMSERLRKIETLRHRQQRTVRMLATLSEALPADVWLTSLVDDGRWIDIQGKADNAAALGALLETIPEIDHVAYVGAIRPEPGGHRESFHMRLHSVAE